MSERLKAMRRIAALQAQQRRLAEWRLAATVRRSTALDEQQRDLAAFVDGGDLVGPLATEALHQFHRLAKRKVQAEDQQRLQTDAVREAERRLKLTEKAAEQIAADVRATQERRALEELIESLAGRKPPPVP